MRRLSILQTYTYTRARAYTYVMCELIYIYIYPAQSFDSRESLNSFCGRAPNKKCTCTIIYVQRKYTLESWPPNNRLFFDTLPSNRWLGGLGTRQLLLLLFRSRNLPTLGYMWTTVYCVLTNIRWTDRSPRVGGRRVYSSLRR